MTNATPSSTGAPGVVGRALALCSLLSHAAMSSAAPLKVAFTGDQGVDENARSVLSLIAHEGTELLLIQGDLGYEPDTAFAWEANLDDALTEDFPVLTVVGNHENHEWPLYRTLIHERIDRVNGLGCSGEPGVKASCRYENIHVVQVAPGIGEVEGVDPDDDYAGFIASSFRDSDADWRICAWHKNQNALQTGHKDDETGWEVYEACLDAGAMVVTGHDHAYSRTFLLDDFERRTIVHTDADMTLEPGRSFAVVSGLGGRQVLSQRQGGDWWASIYTAVQGATFGALFCSFEERTAECYFKAIDGAVPDRFSLRTVADPVADAPLDPPPSAPIAEETPDTGGDDPTQEPPVSVEESDLEPPPDSSREEPGGDGGTSETAGSGTTPVSVREEITNPSDDAPAAETGLEPVLAPIGWTGGGGIGGLSLILLSVIACGRGLRWSRG